MSGSSYPGWTWDEHRQDYCYWAPTENCFIFRSGLRVYPQGQSAPQAQGVSSYPTQQDPNAQPAPYTDPRTVHVPQNVSAFPYRQRTLSTSSQQSPNYEAFTGQFQDLSLGTTGQPDQPNWQPQYPASSPSAEEGPTIYPFGSPYEGRAAYTWPRLIRDAGSIYIARDVQEQPKEDITDPSLHRAGLEAVVKIKETTQATGSYEPLDHRFQRQSSPKTFFKVGRVFRMLWPELAGDDHEGATIFTGVFNERFQAKIRWFVVIKTGVRSCSCLPIQTYNGKGVAKKGLVKGHHAIIHIGSKAPSPKRNELPKKGESPMRRPIRVTPAGNGKMDAMSRLNYDKIYTVEHNVKVRDFGFVHRDCIHRLVHTFKDHWNVNIEEEQEEEEEEEEEGEEVEEAQAGEESNEDENEGEEDSQGEEGDGEEDTTYPGHERGEGSRTNYQSQ